MNARRVSAAAGVILAAQKTKNTPSGIACSLEAACLLQSPESAAELVALQGKYAEAAANVVRLTLERGERLKVENALRDRVTELETQLADRIPVDEEPIRYSLTVSSLLLGALAEQRHLVDPLDHVMEHLADDLPEVTL